MGWRASALIIILVFGVLLSMLYFSATVPHQPNVSIVTIPEGAQLDNFEPQTIKVVIGTNNTVRWINQDSVPSSVVADDDSDPSFFKATQDGSANPTDQSLLFPDESFEHTFTKAGVFGYHSVPHPQIKGTVIVLPAAEK